MGLFDTVKKIGKVAVNPIGSGIKAVGGPDWLANAANPIGAAAEKAVDVGGDALQGNFPSIGGTRDKITTNTGTTAAGQMGNVQGLQGQAGNVASGLLGSAGANPISSTNVASTSGQTPLQYAQQQAAAGNPAFAQGLAQNGLTMTPRAAPFQRTATSSAGLNLYPQNGPLPNIDPALFQAAPAAGQSAQRAAPVAAPGAFQIGAGGAPVAGQLGARPTVGAAPGNVAGSLGGQYTPQSVGGIAGQLGAGPQAGNVGNIAGSLGGYLSNTAGQLGAAPGAVAGQLGAGPGSFQMGAGPAGITGQRSGFGQTNSAQGEMLSRLSGFLDAPEGPSIAEAQLQQSQADNMSSLIGAARSGRGGAGASAEAMRGALSEGGAVMADTAGQMATLRAQEEDMRKNRQLSGIGLGGEMAGAQRAGDLTFGAQELSALQGDQATALGTRGQDLSANVANQSNALNVRGQNLSALQGDQSTSLGARGQNLGALLGDQSASVAARGQNLGALQSDQGTQLGLQQLQGQLSLGARGQDLSALTADQSTALGLEGLRTNAALGYRGQDLSAAQGDQATQLGYQGLTAQTALAGRGQDLSALQGDQTSALTGRGQDLTAITGDADRGLAAQQLNLQRELGLTGAGLTAQQQQLAAAGMGNDLFLGQQAADANLEQIRNMPTWEQQVAIAAAGGAADAVGGGIAKKVIASDETAKTDIGESVQALERHLEVSPGKTYRYKPGVRGQDPNVLRAGPMAGDLEKSPFGEAIVSRGADGLKQVDIGPLALADHAALAHVNRKVDSLRRFIEEAR